jgi:hypothetical protein
MSFQYNNAEQISMFDKINNCSAREMKFITTSWAETFRNTVLPAIDESKFAPLYCGDNGRPNTPVNVVIGALLIKSMTRENDEEFVLNVVTHMLYKYALGLTNYEEVPFSDRTLSRFRRRLIDYERRTGTDLINIEMERLAELFVNKFKLNKTLSRMDSIMVASSCKKMGRLDLAYACVANLVEALVKLKCTNIPANLLKYADDANKNNVCYRLENDAIDDRLALTIADAKQLYELFKNSEFKDLQEFKLLERMLTDQTKDGVLKKGKEISPTSLQNPSDPDATYRKKAGKNNTGFVGNLLEVCGEDSTDVNGEKVPGLNIITHYDYAVNSHSDVEFGRDYINSCEKQTETVVVVTDGAYGSDENFELAKEKNIELVTTSLIGQTPPNLVDEFTVENETIVSCPENYTPIDCSFDNAKRTFKATFKREHCANCPRRHECIVKIQKNKAVVYLSQTTINRARHAKNLTTDKYKELAKKRNGVEGIPSILRRRYNIDHLPVRGLLRTKLWFGLAIGAINIKRIIKWVAITPNSSDFPLNWQSIVAINEIYASYIALLSFLRLVNFIRNSSFRFASRRLS